MPPVAFNRIALRRMSNTPQALRSLRLASGILLVIRKAMGRFEKIETDAPRSIQFRAPDWAALIFFLALLAWFLFRMDTVLDYEWDWKALGGYFFFRDPVSGKIHPNILILGLFSTMKLSVWGITAGFFMGALSAAMANARARILRALSLGYVELIRNIPSLVLVILFYYLVSSQLLDFMGVDSWLRNQPPLIQGLVSIFFTGYQQINAFLSAIIALGIYEGAYISEIIRGGINSVPKGQTEAAISLGMSRASAFFSVVLPQALSRVISPLAGQFISCIKDSAIVSVISIQELTFQGMEIMNAAFLTFEVWITITLLYFVLTFSLSRAVALLEYRQAGKYK